MPKYISGRAKRTPQNKLSDDRYQYLSIEQAEPNIGDPPTASGTPGIPAGQQYQMVSVLSNPGERYWIPIGGGLIPGSISVYDEGSLVGSVSSITQLNFVGVGLTADATLLGIGATITVTPPGDVGSVLFKERIFDPKGNSGVGTYREDFNTSSDLVFNSTVGILTVGNGINVGLGGTIITARATTGITSVGIATIDPSQELDVNGDIRLRGTIYDYTNKPGIQGELLLKGVNGLEWTNSSAVDTGAGGEIGQIQYHNTAGVVDGASNFYFDYTNNRVGIGSTQPTQLLDVLGVSTFNGGVTVDTLYVTGVSTFINLIDAQGVKANSLQVTDLTEDRVVFVGPNGELVDSSNLTFDDYTLLPLGINVTGCTTTSQLKVTGVSTLGNVKIDTNTVTTISGNLTLDSFAGTTQVDDKLYVNNTTQSTTKSTGALTITGGVGILLDVNVGGAVSFNGTSSGVGVTLSAAGGITTTGGDFYVGGDLYVKNDTVLSDGIFEQLLVNPGIATFKGNVEFHGNTGIVSAYWDKAADALRFYDNSKIKLGNSDDLLIYHSSGVNYINNDVSTGELIITGGSHNLAKFINGSSVDLYYDSATYTDPKLQTSGIGVTVTGRLDAATANLSSTLTVGGVANLNGNVNLGNALTDNIVFGGKVSSNIVPNTSETYNLGSGDNRWDTVYAKTFDGLGTLTVEDLYVSGISTFKDDVEFHGTGGTDSKGNVGIKSAFWDKSEMRFRYLDSIEASWGDNRELQIYHFDHSYIKNTVATSNFYIESALGIYLKTKGGTETALSALTDGGVDLYYDNNLRLSTYDKGIKLSANGTVGAAVSIYDADNSNYAAIKSPNILAADYTLTLPPDDGGTDNVLKTDGNGVLSWIAQGDLSAQPGGSDTQVQYNNNGSFGGMDNFTYNKTSGDITITGAASTVNVIWDKSDNALEFSTGSLISFGDAAELQIFNNGSKSVIQDLVSSGLDIKTNTSPITLFGKETEKMLVATPDGRVELFYDGEKTFSTIGAGVSIYGGLADKDGDFGVDGYILKSTGDAIDWVDASIVGTDPGGSDTQVQYNNNGSFGGMVNLTYIDSGTETGNINILDSLGTTKIQWKATDKLIEFKDDVKLRFGSDTAHLEMYHKGGSETGENENYIENDVKLNINIKDELNIQTTSSANVIKAVESGSVTLYYNSFDKLATTTNGIKITGGIQDKDDELGTSGQILSSTGSALDWINAGDVVGGAGGDDTEVQFNNNGSLDGMENLTYNTTTGDITITGAATTVNAIWDKSENALEFSDYAKAKFGTGGDLQIYHDDSGSNSVVEHNNDQDSALYLSSNKRVEITDENHTNLSLRFNNTGSYETELFHATTKRFETTGVGVSIYGGLVDKDGDLGSLGQVLSSTGSALDWINQSDVVSGNADKVKTTKSTTDQTYWLTFVDSNNDPGAYESVYTGIGITFNANNSDLSVDGRLYLNGVDNNVQGSIWSKGGADKKFFIFNDSTEGEIGLVVANSSNDLSVGIVTFKRSTSGGDKSYFRSDVSVPVNESYNLGDSITQRWDNVYAKTYHGEFLKLYDSDKTHKITLQTPSTGNLLSDYTLTLPQNDGGSGEVLTTDGSGVLSWTTKSSGGGGTLTDITVDYTGRNAPCDMPITISTPTAGTKQINIPGSSNAFGAKFVQTAEPTGTSVCEGDIWYDTTPGPNGYGGSFTKVASVKDVKGNTDPGGQITANTWTTRDLNTIADPSSIGISVSSDSSGTGDYMTIPAGTYKITWKAPGWRIYTFQTKLEYSTDSTFATGVTKVIGSSEFSSSLDSNNVSATSSEGLLASVTFSQETYVRIRQWAGVTGPTGVLNGLGVASYNDVASTYSGESSIYTTVQIEDLATAIKEPTGSDIPVGGIIMYSGTDTELNALTNWKLCDGTTYGSVTTPNLKDKFVIGADQYSSGWKTNVTGSLTPDGGSKDAVVVDHNHPFSTTADSDGNHNHSYVTKGGAYTGDSHTEQSETWRLESTVNTGDSGSHQHSLSGTTDSTGVAATNANLPPYFALAYIMRIS